MFNPFKKFMKQYTKDPAESAIKSAKSQSSIVKYALSDDDTSDKAVDYALGLYKQQHKENGTTNPYPWL